MPQAKGKGTRHTEQGTVVSSCLNVNMADAMSVGQRTNEVGNPSAKFSSYVDEIPQGSETAKTTFIKVDGISFERVCQNP